MILALLTVLLFSIAAFAQNQVLQSGLSVTPRHIPIWTTNGVLQDGGGAAGGPNASALPSELGITNTGLPFCINDGPTTGPYHRLCFGANSLGAGLLTLDALGGAAPEPFNCLINGTLIGNCLSPVGAAGPAMFDPRSYGGVCGTGTDSTAGIQTAVNNAAVQGGWAVIPCPMQIAGQVTLPSSVTLTGVGAIYYKEMVSTTTNGLPTVWPPLAGPAITCTGTVNPCLLVTGRGVRITGLNLGNSPQPAPPSTCPGSGPCNNYNPTVFPFIIATSGTSNWNGLFLDHLTFNAASQCIDIEGTASYDSFGIAGAQGTISDIWMNPCMNEGIKFHDVDNTMRISNIDGDFWWNRGNAPTGYYIANNSVFFDIQYLANAQFSNIECYANKTCLQFTNGSVTGNSLTKTFASQKLQFSNFGFNLPCQGISIPNGNGTVVEASFSNVVVGETLNFCGGTNPGTPPAAFFDLSSDFAQVYMSNVQSISVQTFAAIGHGTSGLLDIFGLSLHNYGALVTGPAPAFKVSAGAHFNIFGDRANIVPNPSAPAGGVLIGPGVDSTQGYEQPWCIGGGINDTEGAACVQGSLGTNNTGGLLLYDLNHVQQGLVGACTSTACNINSTHSLLLNSKNGAASAAATFGSDATSHNLINVSPLPTTPPSGTGSLYVCVDNAGNLYTKSTCP